MECMLANIPFTCVVYHCYEFCVAHLLRVECCVVVLFSCWSCTSGRYSYSVFFIPLSLRFSFFLAFSPDLSFSLSTPLFLFLSFPLSPSLSLFPSLSLSLSLSLSFSLYLSPSPSDSISLSLFGTMGCVGKGPLRGPLGTHPVKVP